MPSTFSLPPAELAAVVPSVPPELPAALLERRPDVAAAERRVAAANEQIGLARAAWFPSLSLGGSFVQQAAAWGAPALYTWSVGPSAALSLFEGGKRLAASDAAWASWEAETANYRQIVLQAVQEVEDGLSALNRLAEEAQAQSRACVSADSALRLAMSQYQGGMTTYLQVVGAQTAALTSRRSLLDAQAARLQAAVSLIAALGGGFSTNDGIDQPPYIR
jgi:NodT family efflux transporter outer membrane factor (OMF) lipoprotein